MAYNETIKNEPSLFSLRGSADDDNLISQLVQSTREYDDDDRGVKEIAIEPMTAMETPIRRFYFNGRTAYCVCDNENCKEIQKKEANISRREEEASAPPVEPKKRYRDHLRFMTTSLYQGVKKDLSTDKNSTLYVTAVM